MKTIKNILRLHTDPCNHIQVRIPIDIRQIMNIYASSNAYVNTQLTHAKSSVTEAAMQVTVDKTQYISSSQTEKETYHLTALGNTPSQPGTPGTGFDLRVEMKSPGYRLGRVHTTHFSTPIHTKQAFWMQKKIKLQFTKLPIFPMLPKNIADLLCVNTP